MNETAKISDAPIKVRHYEEIVLRALPSFVIVLGPERRVLDWNDAAARTFGLSREQVAGRRLQDCQIPWDIDLQLVTDNVVESGQAMRLDDVHYTPADGKRRVLGMSVIPFIQREGNEHLQCFLMGTDITERKSLEHQLGHAQRMESIGHLAAGVAHEINTPVQYVGDNTRFLRDSFNDIRRLLQVQEEVFPQLDNEGGNPSVARLHQLSEEIDLEYLVEEIPAAIEQSQKGLKQVSDIVKAMKQFAHPGGDDMVQVDLNEAVTNSITVTRNEWKYDADLVPELDPDLPAVPCLASELNQVILNLIVNASHAIRDKREKCPEWKGTITIRTKVAGDHAEISVTDDGSGIPPEHRSRVFDHFFTTKAIGKGTGQGLSIAYTVIKEKHHGEIYFETETDHGTTFFVRVPLQAPNIIE